MAIPTSPMLERLEAFLAANPNDSFVRYGRAMELGRLGRTDEAIDGFRALLASDPAYVAGYMQAGIHLDSEDLSEGGAFLRSDLLFEVGETLHLEIPLPSGQLLKAVGRVVRVSRSRGREGHAGMGIEFIKLSLQDRRALAAVLVESRAVKTNSSA